MQPFAAVLKATLPPKASYWLRVRKALFVDPELRALAKLAKQVGSSQSVAVDVGANAGIYAAILARHFGQVVCVEPNPSCRRYLRKVLPRHCVLVECAVSDEPGMAELHVPIINHVVETTRGTISPKNAVSADVLPQERFTVEVKRLDDLLRELTPQLIGPVTLLKVDVEGHEFAVFRGSVSLLTKDKPAVVAELEERHGTPVREVLAFFRGKGYRAASLVGGAPAEQLAQPGAAPVTNYVFWPAAAA